MALIYTKYENRIDKTWYNSSNILYSECDDNIDALKTLRISFKNGRTYEYYDVDVNDYLMFKTSLSQGNGFRKFISKYEYKRIDFKSVAEIQKDLGELLTSETEETTLDNKDEEVNKQ